jgi:leader peptidase (prepilin peptidase) / N-methyltransferase
MQHMPLQDTLLVGLIFYFPAIFAFIAGTIIGSLSNVIIYRMIYYKSIWSPPSHCTTCGTEIPGYLNIPLFSYLFLRGRCKFCGARFTSRYFWVELTSGLMYATVVLWVYSLPPPQGLGIPFLKILTFHFEESPSLGFPPNIFAMALMLKGFIFSTLVLILSATDLEHQLIPDRITIPGAVLGLLLSVVAPLDRPTIASLGTHGWLDAVLQSVIGLVVGAGLLLAIAWIAIKILKIPGMGGGDITLCGMVGAFVGIEAFWPSILIGFVVGGVVGLGVMIIGSIWNMLHPGGKKKYVPFKTYIPFGPFLAFGGWIGFFWGWRILSWYLGMFGLSGVGGAGVH